MGFNYCQWKKTQVKFDKRHVGALRASIFWKTPVLTRVKYLYKTPKPFIINVRECLRIIETINKYMPYINSAI